MGIRGLQSFLERECPDACYEVSIPELVAIYKSKHTTPPVVIIDSMSVITPLYQEFSWLNGGQLKQFKAKVEKFIRNFNELGCELVVFNDGTMQDIKLPVWKKRRIDSAHMISRCLDSLPKKGTFEAERCTQTRVLPNGLGYIFNKLILDSPHCKFFCSLKECDYEIAKYAVKNKCFAILGQDTDFVIYHAADYYLSALWFNLDNMTTVCYDGKALARSLSLEPSYLPLLGSLLGNDIIQVETLKVFHGRLHRHDRNNKKHIVRKVSDYIKRCCLNQNVESIGLKVFESSEMGHLLQKSIDSYTIVTSPTSDDTEEPRSGDENWDKVVRFIKEQYVKDPDLSSLYDVIILQRFTSSTCLENYCRDDYMPTGMVTQELRRWIYGIALHEKHKQHEETYVSELVMTGFDSMDDYKKVYPRYITKVEHPGLIKLMSSQDKLIDEKRWAILEEIFQIDKSALRSLSRRFLVPVLTLKYILDMKVGLQEWECEVLLACNTIIHEYSVDELAALPRDPIDYRSIWVYTIVSRSYTIVNKLLVLLGIRTPFLYEYTDGQLYHMLYRRTQKGSTIDSLCGHQAHLIDQFLRLKAVIFTRKKSALQVMQH